MTTVDDQYGNPVPGVNVTFFAPSSGGSGVFSNSTSLITGTTSASGQVSEAFIANSTSGSYVVSAVVNGVSTPALFTLTNNAAAAFSITAAQGTPQVALANTAFAIPLVVTVDDQYGNPVPGQSVTFTAPATATPSGLFSNSTITITGTTNASGQLSESFTANSHPGSYTISAAAAGLSTPASFSMSNTAAAPPAITATTGTPQSATVNTVFTTMLVATVLDSGNNPISGVLVTFVAPTSSAGSAGGVFMGGVTTITGTTNLSGQVSESFTANTTVGSYIVRATAAGATGTASYNLTNTVGTAATIVVTSGSLQSTTVNTTFGSALAATVDDAFGNPVPARR